MATIPPLQLPARTSIRETFWRWQTARMVFTIVVIGYAWFMISRFNALDDRDYIGRAKFMFAQNVLFGDRGSFGRLLDLWIISLIALITYPLWGPTFGPLLERLLL